MTVENATYIDGLNPTNPPGGAPKAEGDNHIRLLKSAVKSTFPSLTGAVTATQAELNILDGATVSTAELNVLDGITASTAELNILDGAVVSTAELNALEGVAGNVQEQLNAEALARAQADVLLAPKASPAFTGTPTAPTAPVGTNTTQIATMAALQQAAFSAALPAQAGQAGRFLSTDGANASWAQAPNQIARAAKTAAYTVVFGDRSNLIDCTGTFALAFSAAATLASGWFCYVRNTGTGVITLDPSGSETIDGAATAALQPGEVRLVQCDGVELRSVVMSRGAAGVLHVQSQAAIAASPAQSLTQNAQTTVVFNTVATNTIEGASLASNQVTLPAGSYRVRFDGPSPLGCKVTLRNNTTSTVLLVGATGLAQGNAVLDGLFTLTATGVLVVQAYTSQASNSIGGAGSNDGNVNVGVNLIFTKVA